jgi:chaperonin GroEL (HSP60 family)
LLPPLSLQVIVSGGAIGEMLCDPDQSAARWSINPHSGFQTLSLQVIVSGGAIGEMAMHFIEKYGLLALRIPSKFDMRRFCRATGSVAIVKLQAPQPDELGFAKQVGTVSYVGTIYMKACRTCAV